MLEKLKKFAEGMDALRIWPRVFISLYMVLLYDTTVWFMALKDPSNAQAGLISVIVGAGAAWFGAYVNSGKKKD